jgi:hypothetical protein
MDELNDADITLMQVLPFAIMLLSELQMALSVTLAPLQPRHYCII